MSRATRVSIRLPAPLFERARQEADRHHLRLAEFLAQLLHADLAGRYCEHAARMSEPPAPPEPAEAD